MRPGPPLLAGRIAAESAFRTPLDVDWYRRPTDRVARDLLGQLLVRRAGRRYRVARIVETEAYIAGDRANHAIFGPSLRNRSMFGPPATLYVYRIHQVHCMNAVTGGGEAVLLRSAEPVFGLPGDPRGPGRLSRVLKVGRELNGTSLVTGDLRIAAGAPHGQAIDAGTRVGIRHDVARRLRFALRGNPWVSRPRLTHSDPRRRAGPG
jgi:DNA-3-methyladenine glycosylase